MWTSECGPCSAYRTLIFVQALNVISFKLLSDFVDASVEEQVCVDAQLDHPTAQIHIHAGARRRTQRDPPAYTHTRILSYPATARPGGCAVVLHVDRRKLRGNDTAVVALHIFHE